MDVIPKKGSVVRFSRDSVAFDFRDRIELRRRGRIIDSTANLKQHNTAIGLCAEKCSGGFIKIGNMKISGHMLLQSILAKINSVHLVIFYAGLRAFGAQAMHM